MTEKTEKKCLKCHQIKPLQEFGINRARRDGLQSACKTCHNAHYRQWYEANPEKKREYHRKHPGISWAATYRKRIKHLGHTPVIEPFCKVDVLKRYGDRCYHCPEGAFEHLDHYPIPVVDGGHHTLENVKPSCVPCNTTQGTKLRRATAQPSN